MPKQSATPLFWCWLTSTSTIKRYRVYLDVCCAYQRSITSVSLAQLPQIHCLCTVLCIYATPVFTVFSNSNDSLHSMNCINMFTNVAALLKRLQCMSAVPILIVRYTCIRQRENVFKCVWSGSPFIYQSPLAPSHMVNSIDVYVTVSKAVYKIHLNVWTTNPRGRFSISMSALRCMRYAYCIYEETRIQFENSVCIFFKHKRIEKSYVWITHMYRLLITHMFFQKIEKSSF